MSERRRLLVALLLDGEAATEVQGLRRALGARPPWRTPPHVTLVPPTNVRDEELADVLSRLERLAGAATPIAAQLGPAATFAPDRSVAYLAVSGDDGALAGLASAAAAGSLTPPHDRAARPFVPHVTLASGLGDVECTAALAAFARYRRAVTFTGLHLLEQDAAAPARPWHVVASTLLGGVATIGRGGRELVLTVSDGLDPVARAWAGEAWERYSLAAYGSDWAPDAPFAVVARVADGGNDRIVGVATGEVRGETCECARLIVAEAERGMGIGSQLLRHVERLAAERGCARVRLRTRRDGPAVRFYADRGYRVVAELPEWREGADFVVMARTL